MPLLSFFSSPDSEHTWSVARAAGYGAAIGVVASSLKAFAPSVGLGMAGHLTTSLVQIGVVTTAFAILCAALAMLRNFILRRLVWREGR